MPSLGAWLKFKNSHPRDEDMHVRELVSKTATGVKLDLRKSETVCLLLELKGNGAIVMPKVQAINSRTTSHRHHWVELKFPSIRSTKMMVKWYEEIMRDNH